MSQDENAQYKCTHAYNSSPKYPAELSTNATLQYFQDAPKDDSDTVVVDNKVLRASTHLFAEGDFIPPNFFKLAHLDGFTRRFSYSQWAYEMRRQAQPVLPFLFLGPSSCLRDFDYLRSQGFTLLLGVRNTQSALARLVSGEKAANGIGVVTDTIDVRDNQELISAFPRAIRRINDHLAGLDSAPSVDHLMDSSTDHSITRKVLVFCESGNERSASVVIAYLMAMLNQEVMYATRMLQQHRFCVSIEDPLKRVLMAFASILDAKRDVEKARRSTVQMRALTLAPPPVPPMLAKKRSFHDCLFEDPTRDYDDMDMDADDCMEDRKPVAPFQDRVV